ncbi:hypothetical protein KDA11_06450, partial [Candidatus Saccharibacteria bacterium]|nr:hypothetical protein [Candidatus Saccharibacteria bacterium]
MISKHYLHELKGNRPLDHDTKALYSKMKYGVMSAIQLISDDMYDLINTSVPNLSKAAILVMDEVLPSSSFYIAKLVH